LSVIVYGYKQSGYIYIKQINLKLEAISSLYESFNIDFLLKQSYFLDGVINPHKFSAQSICKWFFRIKWFQHFLKVIFIAKISLIQVTIQNKINKKAFHGI